MSVETNMNRQQSNIEIQGLTPVAGLILACPALRKRHLSCQHNWRLKNLQPLPNPKRDRSSSRGRAGWYPYYAGFSANFADAALDLLCESKQDRVLDPWNGSGTTTAVSAGKGFESFGFDLNPVMAVVARARLLNKRERSSLLPLARTALASRKQPSKNVNDALCAWFKPSSVSAIREVETGIQSILMGNTEWVPMAEFLHDSEYSDLVSFFYVALFRTVRGLLTSLQSSNPTWMKVPASPAQRLQPSRDAIRAAFLENVREMEDALNTDQFDKDGKVHIGIASSSNVPLPSESIDLVLTSPPYCTRIDYAAATRIELSVLGVTEGEPFDTLRRQLLGTPTVPKTPPAVKDTWGFTCDEILERVKSHPSRASRSYYYKGLCQYFDGIDQSIGEIRRALKPSGTACIIVQDSFYKDLRIDLAKIISEMGTLAGLEFTSRQDFAQQRNLAQVNRKSKVYRTQSPATESIVIFRKP